MKKNTETRHPVISCKNVWKVFGSNPKEYLARMKVGHSFDDMRADGYIAGVRNVSLDVNEGEMLVVMGLSGSGKSTLINLLQPNAHLLLMMYFFLNYLKKN